MNRYVSRLTYCLFTLAAGLPATGQPAPEARPAKDVQTMQQGKSPASAVFVDDGDLKLVREEGEQWRAGDGYVECQGVNNILWAGNAIGAGDFHVRAELTIHALARSAATFEIDGSSHFGFEGATGEMFLSGPVFGRGTQFTGDPARFLEAGKSFTFEAIREGDELRFLIDGKEAHKMPYARSKPLGMIGFRPWRSKMQIRGFSASGELRPLPAASTQPKNYTIPTIDVSMDASRQAIVERIPGQYLGHPTTVLLRDNQTILCTYPLGHGGPSAVLKKSTDGGKTWSERLPVPENWATATNCPCLHRLTGPDGVERLFVFEGVGKMRQAVSLDNGQTWTPFEENGLRCIVAPITIVPIIGGRHLMMYHRGPNDQDRSPLTLWQAISNDGGLTWENQRLVAEFDGADLCEPAIIRSPDGKQLAAVARENRRRYNSMLIVSDDEGETWSEPVELPASLTGDRHMPRYAPDGRLVMTFRDVAVGSPTRGDFVGWVGTYDDLVNLREGQYRIRFYNSPRKFDLGYPGLELLPNGTLLTTTYIVLQGDEKNSVVSFRFSLEDIDRRAELMPEEQWVYTSGKDGCHTYRIPSLIVSNKGTVLAFCEGRRESRSDFGNIDMMLKRSEDNGATWGPMQVLADDGDNTMGNPCPVVDRDSGDIVLLLCRNNHQSFVMRSADDGLTFTEPREITESIRTPEFDWTRVATGPGNGIQMKSGRMVVPMWYMSGELSKPGHTYRSGAIFSDDCGKTWKAGRTVEPVFPDCNECEVVEADDGRLCLNMRNRVDARRRAIAWSADGAETWSTPELADALVEPVCDAGMIKLEQRDAEGNPIWLFSNPAGAARNNMTVRTSFDEGATWPLAQVLHPTHSAYSCLGLVFARFKLEWLTETYWEAE